MFAFLFLLLQFSNNVANSPWSAIIVDNVPAHQCGLTAGFYGLFTLLVHRVQYDLLHYHHLPRLLFATPLRQ
jgi:hypothetical protein